MSADRARDPDGRFTGAGGAEVGAIRVQRHPLADHVLPPRKAPVERKAREVPDGVDGVAAARAGLQVLPDEPGDPEPPEDDGWKGAMPNSVKSAYNEYRHAVQRRAVRDTSWAVPRGQGQDNITRAWRSYREIALAEAERLGVDIGEIPEDPPASEEGEEVES